MFRYVAGVTAWALKMAAVGSSAVLVVLSYHDVKARDMVSTDVAIEADAEEVPETAIEEVVKAETGMIAEIEKTEEVKEIIQTPDISESEGMVLKKVAMAEAEGETVEGKALVMMVVLNRTEDPAFPETVEGVVMQEGQFSTVRNGNYEASIPDAGGEEALALVMSGWDESKGAEYFESCKNDSWQSRNRHFLFELGGHKFYK